MAEKMTDKASPKRHAILEAARTLFLSEPYDRVSMDSVAAAANVSKVTIYAHFENKERLFVESIGAQCLALFDEAVVDAKRSGDLATILADLGFRFVENITSPQVSALHGVMIAESQRNGSLTQLFYDGLVARSTDALAGLLKEASDTGVLDCKDHKLAAIQFIAMVQGDFFYRSELGLGGPSRDELRTYTRACADMFLRAYTTR